MKVQIRKDQASAIESFLEHNSKQALIESHARGELCTGTWCSIYGMSFDELATALYAGYEIMKTPEEKVFEYYEESMRKFGDSTLGSAREDYYDGETDGIVNTLNLLGITIEGVTD